MKDTVNAEYAEFSRSQESSSVFFLPNDDTFTLLKGEVYGRVYK